MIYYLIALNTLICMLNRTTAFFCPFVLTFFNLLLFTSSIIILLNKKMKIKEIYLFIFSICLLFLTKRLYISLILILSLVINIRDINKYYKINLFFLSVCLFLIIVLVKFNLIKNLTWIYNIYGYTGVQVRQGLGFINPNFPSLIFWIIRISFYYIKYEKLRYYHFFIFWILTLALYYQVYSRTMILIFILEIILYYFLKGFYKHLKNFLKFIPILHVIFTFLIIFFFKETALDRIFSYRLVYSYEFLKTLNIFKIIFGDRNNFKLALDNSYISLFHDYGILVLILMTFLLSFGMKNLILYESKEKSQKIIFIFLIYLFYSMSEAILFSPYFSFIIILLIKYSYLRKKVCNGR